MMQKHGFVHPLGDFDSPNCLMCGETHVSHPTHSRYNLRAVPAGVLPLTEMNRENPALKWGGPLETIPELGDRVNITMNRLGHGTVTHYFYEHGYLGVMVKLENDPDWHDKQASGTWHHGYAMVFGREIERA